jgi:YfiH family protein
MELIIPDWPAPARVRAVCTTRDGGVSVAPYASLNLGDHVGDDPVAVSENRARLRRELRLEADPCWLSQVHGTCTVDAAAVEGRCEADASFATAPGRVCAVLTADCLPVLFCDRAGTRVAAAHAGWRGLAGGVLEEAVARLGVPPGELLAWLGPAIGPNAFEVGAEVREVFLANDPAAARAFLPSPGGRWMADLYALARLRLARVGLTAVYGGDLCTWSDPRRFYSYRREGRTGRQASLVWLAP